MTIQQRLFESLNVGSMVDVQGLTVDYDGRHRFYSSRFGFSDASRLFAKVYFFHRYR
jgi:hypothetical protein